MHALNLEKCLRVMRASETFPSYRWCSMSWPRDDDDDARFTGCQQRSCYPRERVFHNAWIHIQAYVAKKISYVQMQHQVVDVWEQVAVKVAQHHVMKLMLHLKPSLAEWSARWYH